MTRDGDMATASVTATSTGMAKTMGMAAGRLWGWLSAAAAVSVMVLVFVPSAFGAFGDGYGMAAVNDGAGPLEEAPAYPGGYAFWAGACDIGAAPPIGQDLGPLGGVGARPEQIYAPNALGTFTGGFNQTLVDAPPLPAHCMEWGAPGRLFDLPIWTRPPGWRLPPFTRAGGHGDGTASFTFARTAAGQVDGAVDNIYVDLPPGFVGNPNAVPKCTAVQFNVNPLQCPEESQVGVLNLEIQGAQFNSASNLDTTGALSEDVYPVYNLEPRTGRVAELGFAYASGERTANVRLTAKARTNGDFGVTTFIGQIPAALPVIAQQITLWAVPWAAHNDRWRARDGYRPGLSSSDPLSVCDNQPGTSVDNGNYIPAAGFATEECRAHYDPSWGDTPAERAIKPFLSNETDCKPGGQTVRLATDSYQTQGVFTPEGDPALNAPANNWRVYHAPVPPVTDCASVPFGPDISFTPTSSAADSATGLKVDLDIPQNNLPPFPAPEPGAGQAAVDAYVAAAEAHWRSDAGRATAHLKDTVVRLPRGVSVNLSAAPGLRGCTDDQVGLRELGIPPKFDNVDPTDGHGSPEAGTECPAGSKIGTATVQTPLLDEPLTGDVVLGQPKNTDPQSGEMFRLFLVLKSPERGLVAKIYGNSVADPQTGQLTTTFLNNPELPFDNLSLELKGGPRGLLAMGQRCERAGWWTGLVPWSAAYGAGGQTVEQTGEFVTDSNCGFGFSPTMRAGVDRDQGGANGARFSFAFSRQDSEQWFQSLTAKLPTGLLAAVRDVPLCSNGQANANACPAASRLGSVDASAGSGDPFVLEKKGSVYLTEGYKGAPYGLAVSIPAEGGPFRDHLALNTVVVRQALHVDRNDASVTAVSDPFPTVWHGLPLRVRDVIVTVDRPGFMRNPTDCSPKQIVGGFGSTEGATAVRSSHFQATGCNRLRFKPRLGLRLTGRKQMRTGKHPGVRAKVTQLGGEAGVKKAQVRLPLSLALDPDNAQALCEFTDGTKPDLENHCPRGSIVGRARATSPLLKRPLAGNVYFVKNVRIDKQTGNEIRTLPMIIVALRGEIAINLRGESSTTKKGNLVNTFNAVPDAPIGRFNLNLKGGNQGILAVTRTRKTARVNLCNRKQIAKVDFDGQNAKRYDRNTRIKTPCKTNKRTAKQRRKAAAKRQAAKRQAANRRNN